MLGVVRVEVGDDVQLAYPDVERFEFVFVAKVRLMQINRVSSGFAAWIGLLLFDCSICSANSSRFPPAQAESSRPRNNQNKST